MEEQEVEIRKIDLIKEFTVEEVEMMEMVNDPLDAAPHLPFGFLNREWKSYLERIGDTKILWSFNILWEEDGCESFNIEGYVVFLDGQASKPFLTRIN
mgnify:FL=1|jgi:hypothetical protein